MKRLTLNYDRFVLLVWVLTFFIFGVRYAFQHLTILEAFLFSTLQVGAAYPLTTYLTKNLLRKAVMRRRMPWFVVQFFGFCALYAFLIPLSLLAFNWLEHVGVFPDSGYFDPKIDALGSLVGEYVAGLLIMVMINFGFCGLRFFELNLRMREELSRSRLQMLKAQINPHFMFNVLNHVHVLIRKEPELADALLLQYTDILRYQLYNGDKETIPIGQEIQFLTNFIEVEAVRWRGKLNIDFRPRIENPDMEIPPLLFITFVENAFKHVSRSNAHKGYVDIELTQKGKTISFEVANSNDNAVAPSKKEASGIGLDNITRRLDILFPGKYTLETENNEVFYRTKLTINGKTKMSRRRR